MIDDVNPFGLSRSKAAVIAGIGLAINMIVAPIAFFGILPGIFGTGDIAIVFANILASEQQFRIAIFLLTLNFIVDIFVFWALYYFLKPVSRSLSLLTLLFGIMHVMVGLLSISNLTSLLHMVSRVASDSLFSAAMFHAQAAVAIDAFNWAWQAGFVIFGVHLFLRGSLFLKAGYMKKWLGIALLIAASGYLIDGFGQMLISGYIPVVGYVGILEAVLAIWLLVEGRKVGIGGQE